MTTKDRVYFDSCCFIDMVKIDLNKDDLTIPEERKNNVWFLKRLSDASFNGDIEIVTSTVTVAECIHFGDGKIDDKGKDLFMKYLMSGRVVLQVSTDPFVAERARDLYWKHNIYLKGADLIHVASAIMTNCSEFITTDERILKRGKFIDSIPAINALGLNIIQASESKILPASYRQEQIV